MTRDGAVVWLTGRPGSGKTTIAAKLVSILREHDSAVLWLDSDDLRPVLAPAASFDDADRDRFYAALAHLAMLGEKGGVIVVVSATAPKRAHRERARRAVTRFAEVHVDCAPRVCEERDPKGLYRRARRGEIRNLPGFDAPYEAPEHPELRFDTSRTGAEEAAVEIMRWMELQGYEAAKLEARAAPVSAKGSATPTVTG